MATLEMLSNHICLVEQIISLLEITLYYNIWYHLILFYFMLPYNIVLQCKFVEWLLCNHFKISGMKLMILLIFTLQFVRKLSRDYPGPMLHVLFAGSLHLAVFSRWLGWPETPQTALLSRRVFQYSSICPFHEVSLGFLQCRALRVVELPTYQLASWVKLGV